MHLHCNLIYVPSSCKNCLFCNKEQTQLPPRSLLEYCHCILKYSQNSTRTCNEEILLWLRNYFLSILILLGRMYLKKLKLSH